MITRAIRKHKSQRLCRSLYHCFNQLELPWLCPAIDYQVRQLRQSSNAATPPPVCRSSSGSFTRSPPSKESVRHLATEADAYEAEEDVPFLDLPSHLEPHRGEHTRLKSWDASQIIMLGNTLASAAPVFKRPQQSTMTGDIAELLPNLFACVQAGRFDRAAKIVNRMSQYLLPHAPELLVAHYEYLLGLLNSLLAAPSKDRYAHMQRWFQLEICDRDIVPDSRILAIMLKASFAVLDGTKLDRALRKYLDVADKLGPDIKSDALASVLLSEAQMARLLRLLPQEFAAPHEDTTAPNQPSTTSRAVGAIMVDLSLENENSKAVTADNADKEMQELKAADLKGLGMKSLKHSLASMYALDEKSLSQSDPVTMAHTRQERLEVDVIEASIARWREEAEHNRSVRALGIMNDPLLEAHVYEWLQQVTHLVREEIKLSAAAEAREEGKAQPEDVDRLLLGPFLRCCNPEKLTAVSLIAFIHCITDVKVEGGAIRVLTSLVNRIGNALVQEIRATTIKSDILTKLEALPSPERRRKVKSLLKSKHRTQNAVNTDESTKSPPHDASRLYPDLTASIRIKLGALFLSMLVKVAKIPVTKKDAATGKSVSEMQPIGIHSWQWKNGKRVGILRVNQELLNRLKREPVGSFIAKQLPMLVKPGTWLEGGRPYLKTDTPVVRFRDSSRSQQEYVKFAIKRGNMNEVFKALDVIGSVPWKINKALFKVLSDAWNTGEGFVKLAPVDPKLEYPAAPDPMDGRAVFKWKAMVKAIGNQMVGYHSQRCYQNFQLEVARAFAKEEVFYCPHNVDFRGRAYPIPPYFNHMGADYIRGLFLFSMGKRLGETGLRWLKIHLANMYGYDKERLDDREKFAMDNLPEIYDSAENPLHGKRWWMNSSHPWQTLAACIELKNALDSPVPSDYVSHLPIQQDGTCNGLQHYAALGGDSIGAKQVNLVPGDRPSDIYSAVADLVKEAVSKAAVEGHEIAKVLDGKISRKVVKQPVMTNVYGVTYYGAKEQVAKQLFEIYGAAVVENGFTIGQLSAHVASLIFEALGKMFNGAQAIQQWLGECGARISQAVTPEQINRIRQRRDNSTLPVGLQYKRKQLPHKEKILAKEDYQFKSTIVWTTPLGMPVVQPYRAANYKIIKTSFQDVVFEEPALSDPVSKRKQLQAFPPNFIHSLDSSHMMLSALKCNDLNLTFASVHDSFWTHACDVPLMNRVLRDAFVLMHSEDIIGRLREEFMARYKGCFYWAPIDCRSSVAKKITQLRREKGMKLMPFTKSVVVEGAPIDELLLEQKRYELLRSNVEEEQRQGRAMVTPGSLFEAEPHVVLPIADELNAHMLGWKVDEGPQEAVPSSRSPELLTRSDPEADTEVLLGEETDSAATVEGEDAPVTSLDAEAEISGSHEIDDRDREDKGKGEKRKGRPPNDPPRTKVYLWMPITFPPAPSKGSFDVKTLKDSQYFFS